MFALLHSLAMFVIDFFKSPRRLEVENLFLRHQLSIALRRAPPRLRLRGSDRALMVWLTRLWPSLLGAAHVVQPETTKDCGRTPVTLEEVREWARGQDEKHLRFRINHRLNDVLDAYENPPDCGAVPLASQEGESKLTRSGYEWIGHSSEGASATASSEGLQRRMPLLSGPAHREA